MLDHAQVGADRYIDGKLLSHLAMETIDEAFVRLHVPTRQERVRPSVCTNEQNVPPGTNDGTSKQVGRRHRIWSSEEIEVQRPHSRTLITPRIVPVIRGSH